MNQITERFLLLICSTFFLQGCLKGDYASNVSTESGLPNTAFAGAKSAENLSGTAIQINWDLSPEASVTEYNIYLIGSNENLNLIGVVNPATTLFVHTGLDSGHLYQYVVRAVTSIGPADSNRQIVSAISYAGLTSATVVDATTADLTFPAATDAASLKVYCSIGTSGAMSLMTTLNAISTTHRLTDLTTASLYSCKVKAALPDGTLDFNPLIASFTPQTVVPNSPFGFSGIVSANNTSGSEVLIQWAAANPASGTTITGYRIYQTNSDDSLTVYNAAANATSYAVTGLSTGTNYNFIVRALDANSVTDGNQVVKSAFAYAGITSGSATSATSAVLYFPAAPMAANLHVYCYPTSGSQPSTPTASVSSTLSSYTVSSLVTATNYTCLVKAVGPAGEDGNTAAVSFTTP